MVAGAAARVWVSAAGAPRRTPLVPPPTSSCGRQVQEAVCPILDLEISSSHDTECRYIPQTAEERRTARQLLIAARTSRLYIAGSPAAGVGCAAAGRRFTAPEQLLLTANGSGGGDDGSGEQGGGSGAHASANAVSLCTAAAAPRPGLGSSISVRAVAAAADFAVLLTWDGAVLDTRCLAAFPSGGAAAAGSPRQRSLDWSGLWRPPCCRAVGIAAGGCWQGECWAERASMR